jgi:hypothetical protein
MQVRRKRVKLLITGCAALVLAASAALGAGRAVSQVCGSGANAAICIGSIDRAGKLDPEEKKQLADAARVAIDVVSSPRFEAELAAFHAALPPRWVARNRYWRGFDPRAARAATRAAFACLHVETRGGKDALRSARLSGNLAYEGRTDKRTGERSMAFNRYRLDRPLGAPVGTYVHEAAHKGGYSHRPGQTADQKCEPPYVMGQLARKLAEPEKWAAFVAGKNACRFWQQTDDAERPRTEAGWFRGAGFHLPAGKSGQFLPT